MSGDNSTPFPRRPRHRLSVGLPAATRRPAEDAPAAISRHDPVAHPPGHPSPAPCRPQPVAGHRALRHPHGVGLCSLLFYSERAAGACGHGHSHGHGHRGQQCRWPSCSGRRRKLKSSLVVIIIDPPEALDRAEPTDRRLSPRGGRVGPDAPDGAQGAVRVESVLVPVHAGGVAGDPCHRRTQGLLRGIRGHGHPGRAVRGALRGFLRSVQSAVGRCGGEVHEHG